MQSYWSDEAIEGMLKKVIKLLTYNSKNLIIKLTMSYTGRCGEAE